MAKTGHSTPDPFQLPNQSRMHGEIFWKLCNQFNRQSAWPNRRGRPQENQPAEAVPRIPSDGKRRKAGLNLCYGPMGLSVHNADSTALWEGKASIHDTSFCRGCDRRPLVSLKTGNIMECPRFGCQTQGMAIYLPKGTLAGSKTWDRIAVSAHAKDLLVNAHARPRSQAWLDGTSKNLDSSCAGP